ncbi:MAG: LptF/LptG family permease [Gemmatimonadaceae bacterium]
MKILTKYVLKEHIGPLFFALSALTSLLMLQFVARQLGNLVGKGLPWTVIAEFFVLSIPFTVALTLPMAVLVATLYAFGKMATENEVTAFKASGVRVTTLMMPVFIGAAVLVLGMVAFNDQVLPRANHRLRILQQDMARTKPTLALSEQVLNQVTSGFYMQIGRLDRESNRMTNVTIYDLSQPLSRKTIYADSGDMSFAPNKKDLQLILYDGYQQETSGTNANTAHQLRRTYFRSQAVRVKDIGGDFEQTGNDSWKGNREKSICEMQSEYMVNAREYERVRQLYIETARRNVAPGQKTIRVPKPRPASEGLARLYCNALALVFRIPTATPSLTPNQQSVTAARSPAVASPANAAATPNIGVPNAGTPGAPPALVLNTNAGGTVAVTPPGGSALVDGRQTVPVPTPNLSPAAQAALAEAKKMLAAPPVEVVPPPTVSTAATTVASAAATTTASDSSKAKPPVVATKRDSTLPPPVAQPIQANATTAQIAAQMAAQNAAAIAALKAAPPAAAAPVVTTPAKPPQTIPPAAPNSTVVAPATGTPQATVPPTPIGVPGANSMNVLGGLDEGGVGALNATNSQLTIVRESMDDLAVEVQKKFALSFACLVFVLFGPPIALRFPRGGVGATLGISLIVFGLYYVCLSAGETLADDGKLPPWVAMWIANVIFTIVGLLLLLRIEKTADASRGGGIRAWLEERKLRRASRSRLRVAAPSSATP